MPFAGRARHCRVQGRLLTIRQANVLDADLVFVPVHTVNHWTLAIADLKRKVESKSRLVLV